MQLAYVIEDLQQAVMEDDVVAAVQALIIKYHSELKELEEQMAPDYEWINEVPV